MDETERHFWMAAATIAGLVFALLVYGPLVNAYRKWNTRREFRLRRESYERRDGSRV